MTVKTYDVALLKSLESLGYNRSWLSRDSRPVACSVTYGSYEYDFVTSYTWGWVNGPTGSMDIGFRIETLNLNPGGLGVTVGVEVARSLFERRIEVSVSTSKCHCVYLDLSLDADLYFPGRNVRELSDLEYKKGLIILTYELRDKIEEIAAQTSLSAKSFE